LSLNEREEIRKTLEESRDRLVNGANPEDARPEIGLAVIQQITASRLSSSFVLSSWFSSSHSIPSEQVHLRNAEENERGRHQEDARPRDTFA